MVSASKPKEKKAFVFVPPRPSSERALALRAFFEECNPGKHADGAALHCTALFPSAASRGAGAHIRDPVLYSVYCTL